MKSLSMEERNRLLIDTVIKKAKSVCSNSLAILAVNGSFLTGDIHEKADLDLMILIDDVQGLKLKKTFKKSHSLLRDSQSYKEKGRAGFFNMLPVPKHGACKNPEMP